MHTRSITMVMILINCEVSYTETQLQMTFGLPSGPAQNDFWTGQAVSFEAQSKSATFAWTSPTHLERPKTANIKRAQSAFWVYPEGLAWPSRWSCFRASSKKWAPDPMQLPSKHYGIISASWKQQNLNEEFTLKGYFNKLSTTQAILYAIYDLKVYFLINPPPRWVG